MNLIEKIQNLKKEKDAIVLVHNYQRPEIHEIADFIGDSLGLCQQAAKTDAKIILFCGVSFMAQSAKILNPNKKVLVPYSDAGCAMADMVDAETLQAFKKQHPDAAVVTYVNSTAAVKAVSDVCCTSSNAVEIVRKMPQKKIIFVPDKNLAAYVSDRVPEKQIIAWDGYCPIHHFVDRKYLDEVKKQNPKAKIIAHPESKAEVLEIADHITSTTGMIEAAKHDPADEFFVLTECGMTERLRRTLPNKKFHGLCNLCYDMKKNDLQAAYQALKSEQPEITVDPEIAKKARRAFDKMFQLT